MKVEYYDYLLNIITSNHSKLVSLLSHIFSKSDRAQLGSRIARKDHSKFKALKTMPERGQSWRPQLLGDIYFAGTLLFISRLNDEALCLTDCQWSHIWIFRSAEYRWFQCHGAGTRSFWISLWLLCAAFACCCLFCLLPSFLRDSSLTCSSCCLFQRAECYTAEMDSEHIWAEGYSTFVKCKVKVANTWEWAIPVSQLRLDCLKAKSSAYLEHPPTRGGFEHTK